jgi:dUTP pyrophosphatase
MEIKVKKNHPKATIPVYATDGSACFDLHAVDCGDQSPVLAGGATAFRTGLSFEIPNGYAMLIFSRSGHGFKNSTRLSNCVGVIDSDYRGEVAVKLHGDSMQADILRVSEGDRIAQAMVIPVIPIAFQEVDYLPITKRGVGGFGSTGA